jgi:hypothetical protein
MQAPADLCCCLILIFSSQFSGGIMGGHKSAPLAAALKKKGWNVKGVFWCGGETRVLFKNRMEGHPDAKDLEDARVFAKGLLKINLLVTRYGNLSYVV